MYKRQLLARTDPDAPRHQGISYFVCPMDAPGIEIRPIKQVNGQSGFNEVYFTNVRIPDAQRLGKVNDGWNVSLTTLMNERFSIGARLATGVPEFLAFASEARMSDGTPALDDREVRSRLATWAARSNGLKYTAYRAISALSRGERPGPENSIGKLVAAPMTQDIAMYAMDLQGPMGAVSRDDNSAPNVFVFISPDASERKYLCETLKLDEHTLNSALAPDEQARLEFEPEHVAMIFKRPSRVVSESSAGHIGNSRESSVIPSSYVRPVAGRARGVGSCCVMTPASRAVSVRG